MPPVSVIVPTPSTSSPGGASAGSSSVFSPDQPPSGQQSEIAHPRRPLVLPRVYSCPRYCFSLIQQDYNSVGIYLYLIPLPTFVKRLGSIINRLNSVLFALKKG